MNAEGGSPVVGSTAGVDEEVAVLAVEAAEDVGRVVGQ
jgi:hypothetical protein